MKLLVIGGTGILSTAVVEEAINRGIEVTMINRGNNKLFIHPKARLIIGDVRNNPEGIRESLKNEHFDSVIDFLIWNRTQLQLSLELFSQISNQYVFISSAQAYNTSVKGVLTEDSELVQPLWGYSINKVDAETYLQNYCKEKNITYTIIRPGVNYGNTRIPYGMYPIMGMHWTMVERIKAGKPILTWNNGTNRLNLTRVEDFALGAVGLIGNEKAYNEIFNVVGDYVYSWMEVLETLGKLIGHKVETLDVPVDFYAKYLLGDTKEMLVGGRSNDLICSNEKLKNTVPYFETKYSLEEGLKITLNAYNNNNFFKGFDYGYDARMDRIVKDYIRKERIVDNYNSGMRLYGNEVFFLRLKAMKNYYVAYFEADELYQKIKKLVKLLSPL